MAPGEAVNLRYAVVRSSLAAVDLPGGDGDPDILLVMQNAGLPEAGDAVLTFPPEVLADPEAYAQGRDPAARCRRR